MRRNLTEATGPDRYGLVYAQTPHYEENPLLFDSETNQSQHCFFNC